MLSVIARACRHPIAYSGVYRTTNLTLQKIIRESEEIYSFIFSAPKLPKWRAGQHAIFTLPNKDVSGKSYRPFSVASAPSEGVIRISTIISKNPSSFKENLLSLQSGQLIRMRGPYGEFCIKKHMKKVVGVAGGIGITPFRSLINDLVKKDSAVDFTLIYSAKPGLHTFKDELDILIKDKPNLKIIYTNTPDEVNTALDEQIATNHNRAYYFLSGSPGMITALKKSLKQKGIRKIISDPFKGY